MKISIKVLKLQMPLLYDQISDGLIKKEHFIALLDQLVKIADDTVDSVSFSSGNVVQMDNYRKK